MLAFFLIFENRRRLCASPLAPRFPKSLTPERISSNQRSASASGTCTQTQLRIQTTHRSRSRSRRRTRGDNMMTQQPASALSAETTTLPPCCEIGTCRRRLVEAYCSECHLPSCHWCYEVYLGIPICGDCDPHDGIICCAEVSRPGVSGKCPVCRSVKTRSLQGLLQ